MRWGTGENWNLVMDNLGSSEPYEGVECKMNQTYEEMQRDGILGWGSNYSIPYFTSFVCIITFIVLNLTIAAVIDGLSSANKDEGALISIENVDWFIDTWSDYDPNASGWISIDSYIFLIFELPKPIGLGREEPSERNIGIDKIYSSLKRQNLIQSQIIRKKTIDDAEFIHEGSNIQLITDKGIFIIFLNYSRKSYKILLP